MLRRRLLQRTLTAGLGGAGSLLVRATAGRLGVAGSPAIPLDQPVNSLFTLATPPSPADLGPHSAYDAGSGVAVQGPFEGLIRLKSGTTDVYVPLLATSWEANADASVWTFHLREGVTFHDGTPLDAEAARASFERLFALGLAPSAVLGRFITSPAQIAAPSPTTLVFDLGRPQPLFEAAMASAYGTAIVNTVALRQHEIAGDWGHAWAQSTSEGVGTGPYRIASFDPETGVVLERHHDYWRGWDGDHFDQVVLRVVVEPETRRALVENGGADLAAALPLGSVHELESNPDLVVDRGFNLTVRYIAMTVAGPLQSPLARQALCWAFPYDDVIFAVLEGVAKRAVGPLAELCRGFDPETFVYHTDLAKARALLQRAGVVEGTELQVLLPPGSPETSAVLELFQTNLAQVGLTLDIRPVDYATYVGMFAGDMPAEERPSLLPLFWQPDYNDAWNHLWPQVSCDAWQAGNGGHYCNQQVEVLLAQARDASDAALYQAALSRIQQIVTRDDPAAIYYAQPEWLTVLRHDVAGYTPDLVVGEIIDFYALHRQL